MCVFYKTIAVQRYNFFSTSTRKHAKIFIFCFYLHYFKDHFLSQGDIYMLSMLFFVSSDWRLSLLPFREGWGRLLLALIRNHACSEGCKRKHHPWFAHRESLWRRIRTLRESLVDIGHTRRCCCTITRRTR